MRIISRLNVGGPAVHCLLLSEKMRAQGFETVLVTGSPGEGEADYEALFQVKAQGFRLVKLRRLQRMVSGLGDLQTLFELIALMRRERPVIVHTHTAKAGVLGRIAAIVTGVPVIVHTFHGHVLSGYFGRFFSSLVAFVEKILAWRSTALVTLSESLREELSDRFHVAKRDHFHIVPLGRDLNSLLHCDDVRGQLRRELRISDPETLLIGIVGRLVPIKNHALLFQACARLPSKMKWRLAVIGEGPLRNDLETLASELGIAERVHFLGWRSDLPILYADLAVSALTSNNEGTPLSIIEAFAAGCPVLSTRVGGVCDMFGAPDSKEQALWKHPEGVTVPAGDVDSLVRALESLLLDGARRERYGQSARRTALNYTDEALVQRMADLYRGLLSSNHLVTSAAF